MKDKKGIDCLALKIIAVVAMLTDHIGFSLFPEVWILRAIGRIAFPIFAYLCALGMHYSKHPKKYCVRMLVFAAISELPYDLFRFGKLEAGSQNVLWTLLIALLMMYWMRVTKEEDQKSHMAAIVGGILFGGLISFYIAPDYGMWGVELALVFYLCHGWKYAWAAELGFLILLNGWLLGGTMVTVCGYEVSLQIFGVLAFIPIFLCNEKQGKTGKILQYFFYAFYPLHMIVLYLLGRVEL